MIKNVVLDVGNVLVEWAPLAALKGLGIDDAAAEEILDATVRTPQWSEFDRGVLPDEEILGGMIEKVPQYEHEIRLFWDHMSDAIWTFSYSEDWIKSLKANGYHVYILSNYGKDTYNKTREALRCTELADGRIFSYEVGQIKPEPEIYQTLFTRFDLVPEECVFIDDRADNIEAAREQGMHGIVFHSIEQAKQELHELGVDA